MVRRRRHTARKEELLRLQAGGRDPGTDRVPRLFGDLELHRPLGLLLHDDRAWGDMTVLEHIANPLRALHTWRRVIGPDATIVLVVPHRDGTFDHRRPVTSLDHILNDFANDVAETDDTHLNEILQLHDLSHDAGAGPRDAFVKRAANNIRYRSLHHHVFDTELLLKLVDKAGLRILYLDLELPYHICVACSSRSGADRSCDNDSATQHAASWTPDAEWRRTSPFPSDRRLGSGAT